MRCGRICQPGQGGRRGNEEWEGGGTRRGEGREGRGTRGGGGTREGEGGVFTYLNSMPCITVLLRFTVATYIVPFPDHRHIVPFPDLRSVLEMRLTLTSLTRFFLGGVTDTVCDRGMSPSPGLDWLLSSKSSCVGEGEGEERGGEGPAASSLVSLQSREERCMCVFVGVIMCVCVFVCAFVCVHVCVIRGWNWAHGI